MTDDHGSRPGSDSAATSFGTDDVAGGVEQELLAELSDDYARRLRHGEHPSLEEYAQRHPALAEQIRELFPVMFVMEQSARNPLLDAALSAEVAGAMVGRYKLLERIGEGGFGIVFMAEQQRPVRRKVALKLIKPGMDTKQVIARFEAERQALALMDHPNIAKVLDAGAADSGRPYFVMELVPGLPLIEYCERNKLPPRERLTLFIQVCEAIQHAHTKGVIHRDLKPTNVLVMLRDGRPVPKVIDFGVAKATGQPLTERTLFTNFAQMLGTPLYMSPEQAQMGGIDVDTRSDVYSLGVLLYELLTGTTPFDRQRLGDAALDEVRRIIREEEPPRPSTRLSTAAHLPAIAVARGMELRRLSGMVRGELDWIVMKAMEKDRGRRYQTVDGLARDVERYLRDEAVQACPPSALYRLRKVMRRHKGPVVAASFILLSLVGGIIGTTWEMLRAAKAEAHAVGESNQKQAALTQRETALVAARQSKRSADVRLFESYLTQAQAHRLSRRPGQRFKSLEVLSRATELARALELPTDKFTELRNAVTASLALPDLYLSDPWVSFPADGYGYDFDEAHAICARTDRRGNCSVRRVADDVELHHLPGIGLEAWPYFSRDGKFLAVLHVRNERPGRIGAAVQLWDLREPTARSIRSEENARVVDFHRDGRQVALAYNDGTICVFALPSGEPVGRPLAPDTLTREVMVSLHPTEPLVAVCSYFGSVVEVRDLRSGSVIASIPQNDRPTDAIWNPDGQTLAVGYGTASPIRLYDRTTLRPYRMLQGVQWGMYLTFNHTGDRLTAYGWGSRVELFDVGTAQRLFTTVGGTRRFSNDDRRLAGGLQDGKLGIWQVGDGRECRTLVRQALPPGTGYYTSVALHPDGRLLAAGMEDGFGLWDLQTGSELRFVPIDGEDSGVRDLCFERSGALLTAGLSGMFRWPVHADPDSPGRITVGPPQRLLPRSESIAESLDGQVIVGADRAVGQWQDHAGGWILHADHLAEPIAIDRGADIGHITVSPDGRWVVTVQFDPQVAKVWDARDGTLVKLIAEWGAGYPHFSPDSKWLAMDVDGGRLFATENWEPGPHVGATGVFAPVGQLMAVHTPGGPVRLIDRGSAREVATLQDPESDATRMRIFTPDGTRLIGLVNANNLSASNVGGNVSGNGIRVWDLRLIRQHLKTMGLDWDWAEFPTADPVSTAAKPLKVEVLLGELGYLAQQETTQERTRLMDAVAQQSNAIALRPTDAAGWYYRGAAFEQLGQWNEALADFSKASELDPNFSAAWTGRGWAHMQLGQLELALADHGKAIDLDPKTALYWNNRAVAYLRLGRPTDALADCSKAIELDPTFAPAWINRGEGHRTLGQFEKSADAYRTALGLQTIAKRDVLLARGRLAAALNALAWQSVTQPDPSLRSPVRAVELASEAVALAPDNGNYWNTLGAAHYRAGDWAAARTTLQKSIDLSKGDDAFDWFFLAMAQQRIGSTQEAILCYKHAIERVNKHPTASDDLRRVRAEAEELLKQSTPSPANCL